eukprot:Skav233985  [mRNA]  locus=scaffold1008:867844:870188:+ [translate_table: standard]
MPWGRGADLEGRRLVISTLLRLALGCEVGTCEPDELSSLQTLLDGAVPRGAQLGMGRCDVLHPKPGLTWSHSKTMGNVTVYAGNLSVPLSPHEEDANETPYIDLLVVMTIHKSVEDAARR